jgi:mRNA-degrading endonuclease toxin of MazEF toxin-antitoxin module
MVAKIFLAKVYFTDLASYKDRPILLIHQYRTEDFLFLPLTTNLQLQGVSISSADLSSGTLKKPSVIIVPQISIIHKSLLIKELGELQQTTFSKVMKKVCESLACQNY